MIYLDTAATSYQKPNLVYDRVRHAVEILCANPGRSGHQPSLMAGRAVYEVREKAAAFFGVCDADRVIFTSNATASLNLAIQGMALPGGHIVITSMEHNSVLRPVCALSQVGVNHTLIWADPNTGLVTPQQIEQALRPETCLVVCTHAANTSGTLMPAEEIGAVCRRHGVPFLLDASQSAGVYDIDMSRMNVDLLACPGHKGLLGLPGTGLLCLGEDILPKPLLQGGTGSFSMSLSQPDLLPDRYESGTLNTVGIVSIGAGLDWLVQQGLASVRQNEHQLCDRLLRGLRAIPGVTVYGPHDARRQAAVVLFNLRNMDCATAAARLDAQYGVCVRSGLHCAPLAHQTLKTSPNGAVRMSVGPFNTPDEIDLALSAVECLAREQF